MARTLQKDENLVPSEAKYKVGDEVTYINDYCVNWGLRTITDMVHDQWGWNYYISPTDTPWCPVREKNLYTPGTEPTFDLELNNGMTVKLVETDWNGNRYYGIDGKKAVLTDGFLYSTVGDWEEPCCRLDEQFQPNTTKDEISTVSALYRSVWDGESEAIETSCMLNLKNGHVYDIEEYDGDIDHLKVLDYEEIVLTIDGKTSVFTVEPDDKNEYYLASDDDLKLIASHIKSQGTTHGEDFFTFNDSSPQDVCISTGIKR